VTGTNAAFDANARVGDAFVGPDGLNYEIANVASPTVISILPAYKGATVSGAAYAIMPVQGYPKLMVDAFNQLRLQFGDKMAALGTTGNYEILPLAKGGTGVAAASNAALLSAIGAMPTAGGTYVATLNSLRTLAGGQYNQGQGGYIGWNDQNDSSGFTGQMAFTANIGGGSGGFSWRSVNAANTAGGPTMTYSYDGLLKVPSMALSTPLPITSGGTGGNSQAAARTALGLSSTSNVTFSSMELVGTAPYIDFHYNNTAADYDFRIINDAGGQLWMSGDISPRGILCKAGVNAARGSARYNMNWTGSAVDFWVDATYIGSVSLYTSDYRIKKYVKDFAPASFLDRIDAYRIVTFQKKVFGDVFRGDGTTYQGLIAHEVQAVNPLAASGEKDGVDEDGNPRIQQLDPIALITDLMGAVKELRAEVNALKLAAQPPADPG
jgi:hypothetical protein